MKKIKRHLKKPIALIVALMILVTMIPFISAPVHAEGEEVITDVYLLFDEYDFTKFRLGYTEGEAVLQFRDLANVGPEAQGKYEKTEGNTRLNYLREGSYMELIPDQSIYPLRPDKEYYLEYGIEANAGYAFPTTPDGMNFYINGVKVEPYDVKVYTYNCHIYMPAGPVLEKYMLRPQRNVRLKLYGHDDIHATWDAQVIEGATVKYRVEYKRSTWSDYKVLNYGTTRNYRKKANLVNGARYKFKVTPYTEAEGETYWGEPGYSRYIYTLKKIAAPRVSKSSRNYVRLRWTNIPGETGYEISRSRYKTKNFRRVKRVSYKYSTTRIKTPRNRTYYYKIRAYKTVDGKRIYAPWSAVRAYRLR